MKNIHRCLLLLALAPVVFTGCGDNGPAGLPGPPGPPGSLQPVRVFFLAFETEFNLLRMVKLAYKESLFPLGTEIHFASLLDSVPSVETLLQYDATLCFTVGEPAYPDSIGDVLADYVDQGGGVVLAQGAYSPPIMGPIRGRIMTEGYSPLIPAPVSRDPNIHYLDPNSLALPIHPVFNGTDVDNFPIFFQPNFSNPGLDSTATLLALDETGFNAIAINADENVIGVNMLGSWTFNFAFYTESVQFMANALMYVGGAFDRR
ncbi:MAG: hypothetical protein ACE5EO_13080 [Candidatus Krumholzibacteriia bacterium]